MAQDLIFTTQSGGSSSDSGQYVKDVFSDVVLPATNNTGLTDTAATNPIGTLVGNVDVPRFGPKTLYVKDLVLIEDRSKWISGSPTYRVIWNEDFPAVVGYFAPDEIGPQQEYLQTFRSNNVTRTALYCSGGRFGIVAKARRAAFLSPLGSASSPAVYRDGSDTSNDQTGNFVISGSSNASNDLHHYQLRPGAGMFITGVIAYFENATADVATGPGTTYVNKTAATTSSETNLALPSYGSSLGGVGIISKASGGAYTFNTAGASTVTSIAQGSSGTNLLNVSTGHGASFPAGSGVVVDQGGGSYYVGGVQSVSTDTLTVFPTLPFGISNAVYRSWVAGASLAISVTTMQLVESIDLSNYSGMTAPFFDPKGKWAVWASDCGMTTYVQGSSLPFRRTALGIDGQTGYINVQGQFSAAEVEIMNLGGGGTPFSATFSVNGIPAFSILTDTYGGDSESYYPNIIKQTLFSEAGGGWNAFNIGFGTTFFADNFAITKINLYRRKGIGATYGNIARLETFQAFADRALSATQMALGTAGRVYADQMVFLQSQGWTRAINSNAVGGVEFRGSTTTCLFTQRYYGKNFAILGTAPTGATVTIDGVGTTLLFNQMIPVASEDFHTVTYAHRSGTSIIQGFDFTASKGEIQFIGSSAAIAPTTAAYRAPTVQKFTSGSGTYITPPDAKYLRVRMVGGGGGGSGGGTTTGAGGNGGNTTFGPHAANGGTGGVNNSNTNGPAGGSASIAAGGIGIAITGARGQGSSYFGSTSTQPCGGQGGGSPFGGAGAGASWQNTGQAASSNTGSGGGGGTGSNDTIGIISGPGGGAGGYIDIIIPSPGYSYSYSVGSAGTAGSAGTNGTAGGAGAAGVIIVEEYYQ